MKDLIEYADTRFGSQYGETGILHEMQHRIGDLYIPDWVGLEYGAGKDILGTNILSTCTGGLLIESDTNNFESMQASLASQDHSEYDGFEVVCAAASFDKDSNLHPEAISRSRDRRYSHKLISIDVDGDDWFFFESTIKYVPIIIVEYNPTIPYNIDLVQKPGNSLGASALALVLLGIRKGYTLACMTETNCIFVKDDLHECLELPRRSFAEHFHMGAGHGGGGSFLSEYNGNWHFLYTDNYMWGANSCSSEQSGILDLVGHHNHWRSRDQTRLLFDPDAITRPHPHRRLLVSTNP